MATSTTGAVIPAESPIEEIPTQGGTRLSSGSARVQGEGEQRAWRVVSRSPRPLKPRDWDLAAQVILADGRSALGALAVSLIIFERPGPSARPLASSFAQRAVIDRWLADITRASPSFNPRNLTARIDANPVLKAVHAEGKSVSTTVRHLLEGVVDGYVLERAGAIADLHYAFACPVRSGDENVAALVIVTRRQLSERQRLLSTMLAQQTALALENARLQQTLEAQIEELERSRRAVIFREEELRKELAELLHGRVQTRLLVAWHRLGQVEHLMDVDIAQASTLLAQVREEIDKIRDQEIRQVSHLLHPSVIQVGLSPAVRSLVSAFEDQVNITLLIDPAIIDLDGPAHNRIPKALRLVAYRAIEEALSNVCRHAHASHVEISMSCTPSGDLRLMVSDDGRGFDLETVGLGLGLTSIAARVEQVMGTWNVSSELGRGTVVEIELPLRAAGEALRDAAVEPVTVASVCGTRKPVAPAVA